VTEPAGCADTFSQELCDAFVRAVKRTGIRGRVLTPTAREDIVDTLDLVARQRYDLVIGTGQAFLSALSRVAREHPRVRFAIIDRSRTEMEKPPANVQGATFRSGEAAYLAGWLAGRLERARPGPDNVGVVAGYSVTPVNDLVVGFRAGARRAAPGIKVQVDYSGDFLDASKCAALARNQVAKGAGALFNVAGGCGLGTLDEAKKAGVWGIGVDVDQSSLGPHILTSVLKRLDMAMELMLDRVRSGTFRTGSDTVLTLRGGGVGLGPISAKVPASLRREIRALERRILAGEIRVPRAVSTPG
jgi:basic membrane protein A